MEILRPAPYTYVKMMMPMCQVCQGVRAEYIVVQERLPRIFLCGECMEKLREANRRWEETEEGRRREEGGEGEG